MGCSCGRRWVAENGVATAGSVDTATLLGRHELFHNVLSEQCRAKIIVTIMLLSLAVYVRTIPSVADRWSVTYIISFSYQFLFSHIYIFTLYYFFK